MTRARIPIDDLPAPAANNDRAARKLAVLIPRREANQRYQREVTQRKRNERRCYWTWPFGHVYDKVPAKECTACVGCGKSE